MARFSAIRTAICRRRQPAVALVSIVGRPGGDFDLTACRPGSGRILVLFDVAAAASQSSAASSDRRSTIRASAHNCRTTPAINSSSCKIVAGQLLPAGQLRCGGRLGDKQTAVLQDRAAMPPLGAAQNLIRWRHGICCSGCRCAADKSRSPHARRWKQRNGSSLARERRVGRVESRVASRRRDRRVSGVSSCDERLDGPRCRVRSASRVSGWPAGSARL